MPQPRRGTRLVLADLREPALSEHAPGLESAGRPGPGAGAGRPRYAYAIRRARPRELSRLRAIERGAGERFRAVGLAQAADTEARSLAELAEACCGNRLFVVEDGREAVGFALVRWVDGLPHLDELAVEIGHGRRGLGRRLVEFVCVWAQALGQDAVTLSTFRDVAWNGPFYRRLGFETLAADAVGPELARLREVEVAAGLDPSMRDFMRRELAAP